MGGLRGKWQPFLLIPVTLAALSLVFLILPLVQVFSHMDAASLKHVFSGDSLGIVMGRSVTASALTTVTSIVLAYALALCMERTAMRCKGLVRTLVSLPMLIPSVSIGMGVVQLLGNSGILTNLFSLPIGKIYGLPGIVLGGVLYALPVAFLMIVNILKFEDAAPYEAATVLGIPKWRQFLSITVPYLRKPMISVIFSVFTLSFTDYGVPLMVGGKYKTLPVVMYQEVIGQLQFGRGCVYGSILLIPAVIAFLLDLANQNEANTAFLTHSFDLRHRPLRDALATVYGWGTAIFCVMPIAAFLVLAFVEQYPTEMGLTLENFFYAMKMGGRRYLLNSVCISTLTALAGVITAIAAAYYTARNHTPMSRYLHLLCMSMAAIPGVVLGLSYVLLFRGSFLYGTIWLLVIVNTVHFFASPYLMMYTSFSKINENLEAVAWTLGIGRKHLLKDVMLPMCRHTLAEMFSYFFVNSMMTISAVSFLSGTRTKPIALMINQFEAQAQMEYAAVVSLLILAVNLTVKAILGWLANHKKESSHAE